MIFSAAAWLAGRSVRRREYERLRDAADAEAQRSEAAAALGTAVAEERNRIARELHDVIAHGMGVMVVQAAAAEQLLESDPDSAREPISTVRATGQDALAEMRRLLGLLRDGASGDHNAPQPGLNQIPALVQRLQAGGMDVTLSVTGSPGALAPGLQLCVYRVVQEALTNALKHAGGARATVTLEYGTDELSIRVCNGLGNSAPPGAEGAGHGLIGMQERFRLYGGRVVAGAQPDGSFVVDAMVPTR